MIHQVVSAAECFNWGFPLHDHGGGGERTASALGPHSRSRFLHRSPKMTDGSVGSDPCRAAAVILFHFKI